MSSHIQLLEDDRVIGLDGHPWSSAPVNAWRGLPLEVHPHMRKCEVFRRSNPCALLLVRYGARGQCRIRSARSTHELVLAPGQVDLFAADFPLDHGAWDCSPGHVVSIELRPSRWRTLRGDDAAMPMLRTRLSIVDPTLLRLVDCMRIEVQHGCPTGRLYEDGLSLALVAHLERHYVDASSRAPGKPGGVLSAAERTRIADYIEAHLGGDLRVARLAALVDVSVGYFIEAFHRSFGATPHRYVVERRLAAGKRLLASDRPIVEIACDLGFASQAHFTAALRKRYGQTPARLRAAMRLIDGAGANERRSEQEGGIF